MLLELRKRAEQKAERLFRWPQLGNFGIGILILSSRVMGLASTSGWMIIVATRMWIRINLVVASEAHVTQPFRLLYLSTKLSQISKRQNLKHNAPRTKMLGA